MQKHINIHGLDFFVCMEQTYRDQGYYIAIPNWGVCVEAAGPQGWECDILPGLKSEAS